MIRVAAFLAILMVLPGIAAAQRQLADTGFAYENASPAWPAAGGPAIVLSSRNSPFVQRGSFDPLVRLLESDGFRVSVSGEPLDVAIAADPAILLLVNAFVPEFKDFPAMDPPSAFTDREIAAVKDWVDKGGSLLVLADHAPVGGGASKLAAAFGFTFLNGHTLQDKAAESDYVKVDIDYTPHNGLNPAHAITDGSTGRKPVTRYFAYGGQSFIPPAGAATLLTIPQGWSAVFTYRIREELRDAPRIDASGMAQGAAMESGSGRLAIFAEAGGFSAQITDGTRRFGFNTQDGAENPEFILSVARWLARFTPKG